MVVTSYSPNFTVFNQDTDCAAEMLRVFCWELKMNALYFNCSSNKSTARKAEGQWIGHKGPTQHRATVPYMHWNLLSHTHRFRKPISHSGPHSLDLHLHFSIFTLFRGWQEVSGSLLSASLNPCLFPLLCSAVRCLRVWRHTEMLITKCVSSDPCSTWTVWPSLQRGPACR